MSSGTWTELSYRLDRRDAASFRQAARDYCGGGCGWSVTVTLCDGAQAPVCTGNSGGYYTRGGHVIAHPGAYSRRGWGNMVYRTDKRTITVGRDWTPTVT